MVVDASRIARFLNLADLPAKELEELAAVMSEVEVEAGATIITVDDYGTAIYFVEEGTADVLDDGDETTKTLGPGETFGEIGLLLTDSGRPRWCRVRRCDSSPSQVRTSTAYEHVYPRSNARCAASVSSAQVAERTRS
jgi:CRP-like cAMP-binding protein